MKSPLVVLSFGAVAGVLLGDRVTGVSWGVWAGLALGGLVGGWWVRPARWKLFLLGVVVFAFLQGSARHDPLREVVESPVGRRWCRALVGVVADAPQADATGHHWRVPMQLESVNGRRCTSQVYLRWEGQIPPQYGERWEVAGRMKREELVGNPGEFDWSAYLRRQGYAGEFEVGDRPPARRLEGNAGSGVRRASLRARDWIGGVVTADLEADPEIAATVRVMMLGTQESTPQDIEDAFVNSGTMHVFAVSGLHVALFALVLGQLLRFCRVPPKAVVLVIIPVMIFYVFVTGLRASAWRAALMASLFLLGPLWDRPGNGLTSLGFAVLLLLGWDPQQLFQAGFQLSFGVVFMLMWLSRPLLRWVGRWHQPERMVPEGLHSRGQLAGAWCRRVLLQSLVVSLCATVGSAPLMIYHFGLVTPVGVVSNLFLVIISEVILATACLSLLCAACKLSWLSLLANNTNWGLAKSSIFFAKYFSSLPGGHLRVDPAHWWDGSTARITVLAMPSGGGATHLDCGRGHWLLDGGPAYRFIFSQRNYLLRYPVTKVEGLILTHRDADHIGAAGLLAETFGLQRVLTPPGLKSAVPLTAEHPALGSRVELRLGAGLTLLYPPPTFSGGLADDGCQVWRGEIDGWRFLFMSDAGFLAEKWLLEHHVEIAAEVLIKGRHTGDFSGLPEFIRAVAPRAVCFTNLHWPVDQRVEPAWAERLRAQGIVCFDQAESGAVEISLTPQWLRLRGFADGKQWECRK